MANTPNSEQMGSPDPIATQIIFMSIITAVRKEDFNSAQLITAEFGQNYGSILPLLVCGAAFANSLLESYAEVTEQSPDELLQELALQQMLKKG